MGTESMNKMKIGSKLLLTYFLLIISIFFITSVSFRIISQRYLIHETELQLQKEAKVMSQLLGRATLSNKLVQEKVANRKALAISERLMSSKLIIWRNDQEIIYSDMKDASLEQVMQQSKGAGRKFVSETVTIFSKSGKPKGNVTLIASLDDINKINGLMRRSQWISLFISALIALVLGIFFEKNITKPIRMLTDYMKNYTVKGANKEISIHTKDEIGELADSFNALSRKLKKYGEDQKVFFHNASHELKTPLMAIQGNAEGILDGVVTGEDVNKSLQVIIDESQRLKKIVEGITYLAKLENVAESFSFAGQSLEMVIREAVQSVKAIAEQKKIEIVVDNHVSEIVLLDREKMTRAFINLLGNAIRYAETKIVVKCFVLNEQQLGVEIIDDGIGFSRGEEKKLFQRFYSGEAGGSGIGLSITKVIIEAHGGSINAFNGDQKGAVFQICLPLVKNL
jgi:signal transduction histidine kinase